MTVAIFPFSNWTHILNSTLLYGCAYCTVWNVWLLKYFYIVKVCLVGLKFSFLTKDRCR